MGRVTTMVMTAALALVASAPLAAQIIPDSEKFLKAIREQDGATADALAASGGKQIVNSRGFDGATPLIVAIQAHARTYVLFLLNHGADADRPDGKGNTPLIAAASIGWVDGADLLLERGAKVNETNRAGETALIAAVNARSPQLVRRLLEEGADADIADHLAGYSAREYAKRDSRMPELARLIETVKKR